MALLMVNQFVLCYVNNWISSYKPLRRTTLDWQTDKYLRLLKIQNCSYEVDKSPAQGEEFLTF